MNIYVVTEGKSDKAVYASWIPFVNPALSPIDTLEVIGQNNFYIISARGYPNILEIIDNAIEDVNSIQSFERLVISVDSEESTFAERLQEIQDHIKGKNCRVAVRIIVQQFCLEAWALGNRQIIRRNPQGLRIRNYLNIFDVRTGDPESLPPNNQEELTRSQFAETYLRAALNDIYTNLTYTKGNPSVLLNNGYFTQVKNRFTQTGHIASFSAFLSAFT